MVDFAGKVTLGFIMRIWGSEGGAVDGDAEPSTASGGCSEAEHPQRSKKSSKRAARSSFRVPQGGGGKYAVATFGAHLCAVRICFSRLLREKQYSYPAQLSVKGDCQGESPVPLCPVLLPFAGAKGRPPRRAVLTMLLQKAPRRRQARKIVIKEGGTYGKEKRTGEGPGRPVPG